VNIRKFFPLVSFVLAVVIIIMGACVIGTANDLRTSLSVSDTYVSSYSFGADFYTEMYNVTYKAVDQLKNIGDGMEAGVGRILTALRAVAKGVGVLTMAVGFAVMANALPAVLNLIAELLENTNVQFKLPENLMAKLKRKPAQETAPEMPEEPADTEENETTEE
jgi:hypothetical protein